MRRRLIRLALLASVLAVAGFLALGLPGAVILGAAMWLTELWGAPQLGGDQVWPAALIISLLGPFALVPADLILSRVTMSLWLRVPFTAFVTLAMDVLLTSVGLLAV